MLLHLSLCLPVLCCAAALQSVRRNLGRVNEDALDFELLELLVEHIDNLGEEGAILIFLPGTGNNLG